MIVHLYNIGDKIWYRQRHRQTEDGMYQGVPGIVTGYAADSNNNLLYQLTLSQTPINIRLPELRVFTGDETELAPR